MLFRPVYTGVNVSVSGSSSYTLGRPLVPWSRTLPQKYSLPLYSTELRNRGLMPLVF